ncbi:MAG TPA: hypothetical protein VFV01_28475 [Spirillospora sp.]|nr:hypothetical protein [Spirillospora sp.]
MTPKGLSADVKYSITQLLYYAPRYIEVGRSLADAESSARERLLGLGPFWGHSLPDKPFASSYKPAQDALLGIARQLAVEIQGIGGGVQMMARTYGIAEADVTRRAARIGEALGRSNHQLMQTGGLPEPPDVPPDPGPATTIRTDAPMPSPGAAPSVPPKATPKPHPAHTPSTPATPNPRPDVAPDANAWKKTGSLSIGGPWPSGDVSKMEEAADAWKDLAGALDTAWSDLQRYTAYVISDNQGPAADQFAKYVQGLTDANGGSLTMAIQGCEHAGYACANQAQAIRRLKHDAEELIAQLVVSFIVGQLVAALTFETTQALTDALDAGIAARITYAIEDFALDGGKLAASMENAISTLSSITAKTIVGGGKGALTAGMALPFNNSVASAFGDDPKMGKAALESLMWGGLLGGAGGAIGGSASAMSSTLRSLAAQGGPGAMRLDALASDLDSGSISVTAASNTLGQLLQKGTVDPAALASAVVGTKLQSTIQARKDG